jgi:cell fate (sporulation/competence/biofilm development) regulator YlbF (YheA/YmcA/DUF963 family)
MDEIVSLAKELGRKIGAHPRTQAFVTAAKAVAADRDAQKILNDFQEQMEKIRDREAHRQPLEPADKRRAMELESQVAGNDKLKAMMRAQADYVQMMQSVHAAIDEGSQSDA